MSHETLKLSSFKEMWTPLYTDFFFFLFRWNSSIWCKGKWDKSLFKNFKIKIGQIGWLAPDSQQDVHLHNNIINHGVWSSHCLFIREHPSHTSFSRKDKNWYCKLKLSKLVKSVGNVNKNVQVSYLRSPCALLWVISDNVFTVIDIKASD